MVPFDGKIDHRSQLQRIIRMDWIGALLCVGWVTCFAISLQWGGVTKKWNSPPVLAVCSIDERCPSGISTIIRLLFSS